jgi:hypothetical protein
VTAGPRATVLRIGDRRVRVEAEGALLDLVAGPLAALAVEDDDPAARPPDVLVRGETDSGVPDGEPRSGADAVSWDPDPVRPAVVARGLGRAEVPRSGPVLVRVREDARRGDAGRGDAVAEALTVPALAERLRRDGVRLVHAGVLVPATPAPRRAWLVPAARGGGKTTLSLSLRGRGFVLLADDRCWLLGPAEDARADPWPEAPRVGDRSLHLLPPHAVPGVRDLRTGKAPVPALAPPRVPAPLPVAGFLVPRLVDGPGGAVRALGGAEALAAVVPHGVIATDPATASSSLSWFAAALASRPVVEVTVGDDPDALAAACRAVASAERASVSTR